MHFFQCLLASSNATVDSIVFGGLLAMFALVVFTGYALLLDPAVFSPVNFGAAIASVLAGIGGAVRVRDWSKPE